MPGVTVLQHSETAMKLSVDTTQTPVRTVLDHLVTGTSVSADSEVKRTKSSGVESFDCFHNRGKRVVKLQNDRTLHL
jgi:hypothetical protein